MVKVITSWPKLFHPYILFIIEDSYMYLWNLHRQLTPKQELVRVEYLHNLAYC